MSRSAWLCRIVLGVLSLFALCAGAAAQDASEPSARMYLHEKWQTQSSCIAKEAGDQISTVGFDANGWHSANIPSTVVAALVADKTYPDPFYATNLRNLPGMYPSNKILFANRELPKDSPFSLLVVVSHGIHGSRRFRSANGVAQFSRHQLPREHLDQRT